MDLRQGLLAAYVPKSMADEAGYLFSALHDRATVKATFCAAWQGPRDTLRPLAEASLEELGIGRNRIGATIDQRGRRILIVPVSLGHVVVRETANKGETFKNWASPKAQCIEGMGRNNVSIGFILHCVALSNWKIAIPA